MEWANGVRRPATVIVGVLLAALAARSESAPAQDGGAQDARRALIGRVPAESERLPPAASRHVASSPRTPASTGARGRRAVVPAADEQARFDEADEDLVQGMDSHELATSGLDEAEAQDESGGADLPTTGRRRAKGPAALDLQGLVSKVAIATGVVLALCVVTLWAGQQWLRGAARPAAPPVGLQVRGKLTLGPRAVVHLVEADGQRVLVAIDAGGVRCMTPLPPSFELPGEAGAAPDIADAAGADEDTGATPLPGATPYRGLVERDRELRSELARAGQGGGRR